MSLPKGEDGASGSPSALRSAGILHPLATTTSTLAMLEALKSGNKSPPGELELPAPDPAFHPSAGAGRAVRVIVARIVLSLVFKNNNSSTDS